MAVSVLFLHLLIAVASLFRPSACFSGMHRTEFACWDYLCRTTLLRAAGDYEEPTANGEGAVPVDADEQKPVGGDEKNSAPEKSTSRSVTGGSGRKVRRQRYINFPSFAYDIVGRRVPVVRKVEGPTDSLDGADLNRHNQTEPSSTYDPPTSTWRNNLRDVLEGLPTESFTVNKKTRLLKYRAYATKDSFEIGNISAPPTLDDLSPPLRRSVDTFWASPWFRIITFGSAYLAFPFLTRFLETFVTTEPGQLKEIADSFGPGISILYGTFVSLTLSILYSRQQKIQGTVAIECSLLAMLLRNMLTLFRNDKELAVDAGQCIADQIRTLVRCSRGNELMGVIYSDPYGRLLELIEEHEQEVAQRKGDLGSMGANIGSSRDILKDLMKTRANRLADEALALPPTHFFVMSSLTFLILLSYAVHTLPTVKADGFPSNESSLLFASLCGVYVLFYNFAVDLNSPFLGVYQIRRSSTAAHLLQMKWLIANHHLLKGEVDFDEMEECEGDVTIRSPGLGNIIIGKSDFNPAQYDQFI